MTDGWQPAHRLAPVRLGKGAFILFAAVVAIQGVHVFEHVLQLVQVYVLGIPDEQAFGILGYVFQFQGTEEWLHLAFNSLFVVSLYILAVPLLRLGSAIPRLTLPIFVVGAVALESWHVVEHVVIISNVIQNQGCPCPGIVDALTGLSDTVLHLGYNLAAYAALLSAFLAIARSPRSSTQSPIAMAHA